MTVQLHYVITANFTPLYLTYKDLSASSCEIDHIEQETNISNREVKAKSERKKVYIFDSKAWIMLF